MIQSSGCETRIWHNPVYLLLATECNYLIPMSRHYEENQDYSVPSIPFHIHRNILVQELIVQGKLCF